MSLPTLRPYLSSFKDWVRHILYGMCMGAADIVPGISGGSMALILGIYEELIFSVKSLASREAFGLFKLKFKEFNRAVSWDFILALGVGILLSLAILSQVIQGILSHEVYRVYLYAAFLGMIISSIIICFRHIHYWDHKYFVTLGAGALFTLILTSISFEIPSQEDLYDIYLPLDGVGEVSNYDTTTQTLQGVAASTLSAMLAKGVILSDTQVVNHQTLQPGPASLFVKEQSWSWVNLWFIGCGIIGVSAMLLPGISGSYLLNILGAYPVVIGALADFVKTQNFDAFLILANLGLGIVIGALLFSRAIAWLLQHYHNGTITFLIGCMAGALQTLWPFWSYSYTLDPLHLHRGPQLTIVEPYLPSLMSPILWSAAAFALLGYFIVWALDILAGVSEKQ